MRINDTVRKETAFVIGFSFVLCVVMQSVYLIVGAFSVRSLIATFISLAIGSLNFFLMGLSLQRALEDTAENAQRRMKASQSLRTLMMLALVVVSIILLGYELPVVLALVIPLLFPRVAVTVRLLRTSKKDQDQEGNADE